MWTGNFSYPQPWYFPGKDFLFLHTFYTQGRTMAMWTSPDGVNWTDRRLLARIAKGHYQISRPFGQEKVGAAFNYHPAERGLNWRTNLYYMELFRLRRDVAECPGRDPGTHAHGG